MCSVNIGVDPTQNTHTFHQLISCTKNAPVSLWKQIYHSSTARMCRRLSILPL